MARTESKQDMNIRILFCTRWSRRYLSTCRVRILSTLENKMLFCIILVFIFLQCAWNHGDFVCRSTFRPFFLRFLCAMVFLVVYLSKALIGNSLVLLTAPHFPSFSLISVPHGSLQIVWLPCRSSTFLETTPYSFSLVLIRTNRQRTRLDRQYQQKGR